jgi:hypothetical protein
LVGLIALTLCAPEDAESGVIRISMSAETTLVGNEGDSPALDVRPYFLAGGSKLPVEGRRRLDPGERYDAQKPIPRESVAAGGYYIRAYVGYADSVGQRVTSMLLAQVGDPSGEGTQGVRLSLSPRRLSVGASGASARLRILNVGPPPTRPARRSAFGAFVQASGDCAGRDGSPSSGRGAAAYPALSPVGLQACR